MVYKVVLYKSKKSVLQKYYLTLEFPNGRKFMHSENYLEKRYARQAGKKLAKMLGNSKYQERL